MNLPKYSGMGPDRLFEIMLTFSRPVRASDMLTGIGPVRELSPKDQVLRLMSDAIGIGPVMILSYRLKLVKPTRIPREKGIDQSGYYMTNPSW